MFASLKHKKQTNKYKSEKTHEFDQDKYTYFSHPNSGGNMIRQIRQYREIRRPTTKSHRWRWVMAVWWWVLWWWWWWSLMLVVVGLNLDLLLMHIRCRINHLWGAHLRGSIPLSFLSRPRLKGGFTAAFALRTPLMWPNLHSMCLSLLLAISTQQTTEEKKQWKILWGISSNSWSTKYTFNIHRVLSFLELPTMHIALILNHQVYSHSKEACNQPITTQKSHQYHTVKP